MNVEEKMERARVTSVAGRTILYTGAAGGLGTETTLQFLRAGAKVVAIDNARRKVESLLDLTQKEGLNSLVMCEADLAWPCS